MPLFLGTPLVRYFKENGELLKGGKVHIYEPGTTTNKNSYPTQADALAETNANTNPVILDQQGYAAIVLKGNSKWVLKDEDDNTLRTVDNVNYEVLSPILDTNGNEGFCFNTTTSAVNHICVTNSIATVGPQISPEGDDTNIDLTLKTKGTGEVDIQAASIKLEGGEGLLDDSGNQQLIFQKTASAINEFQMTNAAIGNAPELAATGGDTNIDLSYQAKGTGSHVFKGTSDQAAKIKLAEDTDNGVNTYSIDAPAAITSNRTLTLPDADFDLTAATQSDQETATSLTRPVTPGNQQFHPSSVKGWLRFTQTGPTTDGSYNVTSVADDNAGDYTITWDTNFSSTGYASSVTGFSPGGSFSAAAAAAGTASFNTKNSSGTDTDMTSMVISSGDQ